MKQYESQATRYTEANAELDRLRARAEKAEAERDEALRALAAAQKLDRMGCEAADESLTDEVGRLRAERDSLRELAESGYGQGVKDTHVQTATLAEEWRAERDLLAERRREAEDALRFYADEASYQGSDGYPSFMCEDAGAHAREALARLSEGGGSDG